MATEYHWILTIAWQPHPGRPAEITREGVITPPQGATRRKVFQGLANEVAREMGTRDVNVVYFCLEPNEQLNPAPSSPLLPGRQCPGER